MIDRGGGNPVVLVPGIQGRWEWMAPTVDALAARGRVITGSLPGDAGSLCAIDRALGFESYTHWLDELLARAGVARVALCGVSFGGWVALHYAAARPERVATLTLVSTPSPVWHFAHGAGPARSKNNSRPATESPSKYGAQASTSRARPAAARTSAGSTMLAGSAAPPKVWR